MLLTGDLLPIADIEGTEVLVMGTPIYSKSTRSTRSSFFFVMTENSIVNIERGRIRNTGPATTANPSGRIVQKRPSGRVCHVDHSHFGR